MSGRNGFGFGFGFAAAAAAVGWWGLVVCEEWGRGCGGAEEGLFRVDMVVEL